MIQVTDVRQTRVYREAHEEARKVIALRMIEMGWSIAKIANVTELSPAKIRKLKKEHEQK
jgi:predicted transposase YdaD